jgi:hypothetical protein
MNPTHPHLLSLPSQLVLRVHSTQSVMLLKWMAKFPGHTEAEAPHGPHEGLHNSHRREAPGKGHRCPHTTERQSEEGEGCRDR